jgi:hypothetical protein
MTATFEPQERARSATCPFSRAGQVSETLELVGSARLRAPPRLGAAHVPDQQTVRIAWLDNHLPRRDGSRSSVRALTLAVGAAGSVSAIAAHRGGESGRGRFYEHHSPPRASTANCSPLIS